jgi:hypothetical protein
MLDEAAAGLNEKTTAEDRQLHLLWMEQFLTYVLRYVTVAECEKATQEHAVSIAGYVPRGDDTAIRLEVSLSQLCRIGGLNYEAATKILGVNAQGLSSNDQSQVQALLENVSHEVFRPLLAHMKADYLVEADYENYLCGKDDCDETHQRATVRILASIAWTLP